MVEMSGSGLAGVRRLHNEREKRRRPRTATTTRPRAVDAAGGCSHDNARSTFVEEPPRARAPRVSPRQRRRIEDTHAYLCSKVDPVMGSLILVLMESRPEEIRKAALDHLLFKKRMREASADDTGVGRAAGGNATAADPQQYISGIEVEEEEAAQRRRLARHQDRVFMAREVGPLVTELIRRTLRSMPADVELFLIEQLKGVPSGGACDQDMNDNNDRLAFPPPNGAEPISRSSKQHQIGHRSGQPHWPGRPSTARSRLQQAQSLDLQVQQTSPPLSGRTEARRSPSHPRGPQSGGFPDEDDLGADGVGGESSRPGGGGRAVVDGVKESLNKPWDVESLESITHDHWRWLHRRCILPDPAITAPTVQGSNYIQLTVPTTPPSSTSSIVHGLQISSKLNTMPFEDQPRAPSKPKQKLAVILLLGLDGAGKTTLLGTLQGEQNPRVRPSVGFKPVTMMLSDELKVKFYDLGGGKNIRSIWNKYYHDAHGLLYVVDGADGDRWGQSKDIFFAATSHKYLQGKPLALILNKEDAGLQIREEKAAADLGLSNRRDAKVCHCSVNASKAAGGVPDERLEGAVEWLLETINESFPALNERVQHDLQDMEREFQLEKERKQLQVMRGLLRKAFPQVEGGEREDCFDESEGLEFLTSEVGLEPGTLDAEGAEIASLVGYQKVRVFV
ncbi:unnamed protein product [Ectocarpus sp. CCAP 1310/34]|nr:unnamed protein product [Ectocarpus sp. CCAP 1310/34]